MTQLRQPRWISTFLVAVIALTCLFASNHCALAALEGLKKPSHACCHEEGPAKPKPQSMMQCCDAFNATVPTPVVAPDADLHSLRPAWLESSAELVSAPIRTCESSFANAPPRALKFAEIVLNRSLLSHAPPHFIA